MRPDQKQEPTVQERSGNVTWLFQQLKNTLLFSSSPAPLYLTNPKSIFISKGFEKQCPNLVESVLAANALRQNRKRELQSLPSVLIESSEPKNKIRRQ